MPLVRARTWAVRCASRRPGNSTVSAVAALCTSITATSGAGGAAAAPGAEAVSLQPDRAKPSSPSSPSASQRAVGVEVGVGKKGRAGARKRWVEAGMGMG